MGRAPMRVSLFGHRGQLHAGVRGELIAVTVLFGPR